MVSKGKRAITLQMDVPRSLKWTFKAIDDFEQLAKEELVKQELIKKDSPVEAEAVISNFLGNKTILKLALTCAVGDDNLDANSAIQGVFDNDGSLQDLVRALQESFFLASSPSRAASLKKSWQVLDELQEIQTEKAILEARKEMETAKDLIKTLGGKKSRGSASSNLESSLPTSGT
jgi:hypothetical protein